jgi:ABC-type transporter Mla MlaB component
LILSLSGQLGKEHLTELERVLSTNDEFEDVVLDLKSLKIVDQSTVSFLAQCEARGTRLQNCSGYIREWINRETDDALKNEF